MNFKKITYSIMLLGMTVTLSAQSTSGGEAVGTPSGALTVSDMGAAVYSLNFEVPDGGPLTPQVGIAYNSQQAGYGLAGYGFNITGISCITRGGKDMFHDGTLQGVTYTADDNFYLDGKRLILKSGTAGENGAVYTPEGNPYMEVKLHMQKHQEFKWEDYGYWTECPRHEEDEEYIEDWQLIEYEVFDEYWFEVITNTGMIYEYGKTSDSQLSISTGEYSLPIVVSWYINRAEDILSNYMTYEYASSWVMQPVSIKYGLNGLNPRGIVNRVDFEYQILGENSRPFAVAYKQGEFNTRLASVTSYLDGNVYRKYTLDYDSISDQSTSKWTRLTSVTEENGQGEQLRPIELDWVFLPNCNVFCQSQNVSTHADSSPVAKVGIAKFKENQDKIMFVTTDLNGDGYSDFVRLSMVSEYDYYVNDKNYSGKQDFQYFFASLSNILEDGTLAYNQFDFKVPYSVGSCGDINLSIGQFSVADVNGDGYNDILIPYHNQAGDWNQDLIYAIYGDRQAPKMKGYAVNNLLTSNDRPLYINMDLDMNGIDEVVSLERSKYNGLYPLHIIRFDKEAETVDTTLNIVYFSIKSQPQRFFPGDYNNDGLQDLLVLYDSGYKIYYNNGGNNISTVFSESNTKTGTNICNFWRIEQGDFDGDGLVDFVYNVSGETNLKIAYNRGNGNFACKEVYELGMGNRIDTNKDDDKFSLKVLDINHDGLSDVMVCKAGYNYEEGFLGLENYYEYNHTVTFWLYSDGNTLKLGESYTKQRKDDALESRIFLGDFDGDGFVELANYGSNLLSTDDTFVEDKINIYKSGGDMSQVGKITSVTDGYGNRTDIQYAFATSSSVYKRTSGNEYPVNTYTLPLSVVANVTSDDGLSTNYNYEDLKIHIGGRGMLGFNSVTKENAILGTKEITKIIDWDTQYWLPKKTVSTSTIDGSTSTVTSTFTIADVNDNYFVYESKRDVTDLDGNEISTSTQYDTENGVILSETEENDGQNMFKKVEYADYQKKTCGWLPAKMTRTQKHKDDSAPYSNTTKYIYDDDGNVLSSTSNVGTAMELTTTATYDEYGNVLTSVSTGNGVKSVKQCYEYDATGFHVIKSYTLPASTVTEYAYDKMGNLLTETDLTNQSHPLTTRYTYDAWGRRDTTISPLGIRTRYEIGWGGTDEKKYYTKVVADGQAPVTTWYDKRGRETFSQSIGPKGIDVTKTTTYNQKGQVEHVESTTGNLTTTNDFTYDARGRVETETSSSGKSVSYSYGNRTVTTTVAGRSYTTTSDAWGNVVQSTDPVSSVEYIYCSNGKPKQVMANGSVVTMEYDAVGNQTKLVDPDAGTMTYTYAADGTLLTQTDARNVKTVNTYDDLGRLISTKIGDKTITYTYGTSGNENMMLVSQSMDGHTLEYKHDELGRVIQKKQILNGIGTLQYDYAYNTRGQLASIVYPGGLDVNYSYDDNGFKSLVVADGRAIYYLNEYDGLTSNVSFMDKLNTVRTLDERGLLSSQQIFKGTTRKDGFTYNFDGATGNLLSRVRRSGTPTTFEYDALDRLVSENGTSTIQVSYAPNGNILSKTNVGNYSYDWAAHPHAVSHIDNIFKRVPSEILNTEFNAFGKIQTIDDEGSGLRMEFTYGPDQQRWRTVLCDSTGTVKRATIYGENYENVTENGVKREFYYLDGNVLIIRQDGDFTPYLMQKDHLGTICSVLNDNGTFVYYVNSQDAWGNRVVGRNEIGLHRGYTGHEMLDEFGIINMNGRLYDPVLGRFFSPDNYVQAPTNSQNFNRYSYCLNNPLKYNDPSGNKWKWGHWLAAAFLLDPVMTATTISALSTTTVSLVSTAHAIGMTPYGGTVLTALTPSKDYGRKVENASKIDTYKYKAKGQRSHFGAGVLRFTWEIVQTGIGNFYSHARNITGHVDCVEYYDGATYVINKRSESKGNKNGLTLGLYININETKSIPYENGKFAPYNDCMYMHEYGHYLQSQEYGPGYLFSVGIPSICDLAFGDGKGTTYMHHYNFSNHDLRWFEMDASKRGKEHFGIPDGKWDYWNYPIDNPANYGKGEYYPDLNNPYHPFNRQKQRFGIIW